MFNIKTLKICLFSILFFSYCNLSPGFYQNAERYKLDIEESSLIKLINQFKIENPALEIPKASMLIDGKRNETDKWHHFYFYFEEENMIVKTWVRGVVGNANETIFAFVGVNEGLDLGNWKTINKDISRSENKYLKELFEDRILSKVKEKM